MEKSVRAKHPKFSLLRGRKEAANDRRFSMIWINKTVHKQLQKRIADLRSELLLRNDALKEEMMAELRELVANEARERSLQYAKSDRERSMRSRLLEIIEEHKRSIRMEDEDEQELLDPRTASLYASENCSVINHRLLLEEILKVLLDILPDVETSGAPNDADTKCDTCKVIKDLLDVFSSLYSPSHQVSRDIDTSSLSVKLPYNHCEDKISSDAENSSPRVKTEQAENQADSLDDFIFSNTSQLILDSEEEGSSRKAPLANSSFITQELRCEAEKAHVDTIKEEEDLLIKRQWKEWMDKQEMGGNSAKVELPAVQRKAETQGGAAHHAPNNPTMPNAEGGHNQMKMKTYFGDLLKNRFTSYKWEKFKNEDS